MLKSFFHLWVGLILFASGCGSPPRLEMVTLEATQTRNPPQSVMTALPVTATAPESVDDAQRQAMLPAAQVSLASLRDLTHYIIDVTIDLDSSTFKGHAMVDLTNTSGQPQDSLFFRLLPNGGKSYGNGLLKVLQTQVNGQPVETSLSVDDTVLRVNLSQDLMPGQRAQVAFDFLGRVPVNFGGGQSQDAYGIYNISQGELVLSGWYPILAVYDKKGWHLDPVSSLGDSVFSQTALYKVDISLPGDQVLVATGVEVGQEQSGDQTQHHLVSGPTRDFFIAASRDFQKVSQSVDGTMINAYFLPGYTQAGAKGLSVATSSLDDYNHRFGSYPFSELDVVQAPLRLALGVEYPGVVLIGASLYDKPNDPAFTVTIAHEIAHQWWYNVVGNDVFTEPWLDEGLTTYSSGLYYQDEYGDRAYDGLVSYWQQRYDTLVQDGKDDAVALDLRHFESLDDPRVYGGVVYTKAALFFKALRQAIGDKAFFAALQAYYKDYQYQVATGDELLAGFEEAAGQPLDDLYQEWLYPKK